MSFLIFFKEKYFRFEVVLRFLENFCVHVDQVGYIFLAPIHLSSNDISPVDHFNHSMPPFFFYRYTEKNDINKSIKIYI